MENVVPIEHFADFIRDTILEIQKGVAAARQEGGIVVDLPDQIQVTATIVKEWQSLDVVAGQSGETVEEQGGGTRETSTGTENGTQNRNGTEERTTREERESTGKVVSEDKQTTTGNEQRTTKESATGSDTTTRTSKETSQQDNAHNQKDVDLYTYDSN